MTSKAPPLQQRNVRQPIVRYIKLNLFEEQTGYTKKAVYEKVRMGVWTEGVHYLKAPDGTLHINIEAYETWLEGSKEPA